jgi:hypothetical protein
MSFPGFDGLTAVAIAFLLLMLILALFEPGLRFKIVSAPAAPLESEGFLRMLAALTNATIQTKNSVQVLTNGEVFYEAELDAIKQCETQHIRIDVAL